MAKLFLINDSVLQSKQIPESNEGFLHEEALEILFKYKKIICNKFNDVRGTFLTDHLSIYIVSPDNRIVIFSVTPSVEYNLISQELWKYDKSFSVRYQRENGFYLWEKAYEEEYFEKLKRIKEFNHGFFCGFNVSKKIGSYQLIYSFATRHRRPNLLDYYSGLVGELCAVGDYVFKSIKEIYEQLFGVVISSVDPKDIKFTRSFPPYLKLITNEK